MASNSTKDYDYKFITEPDDDLKCMICMSVAKDPWKHRKCGRLFCKECINKYGEGIPCPNCRKKKPRYFEDTRSKYFSSYTVPFLLFTLCVCISVGKRAIRALLVKCDNVERGCELKRIVGTLAEHVAVCKFTPVPCPNQCKEKDKITLCMRKDLDHHVHNECPNRDHECEHCGEKDTYANITQVHDRVCEKKIIPCTNTECTETIERGKMKCHLDDCDYTIIPCKYKNIGCDVELKRKDLPAHEEEDDDKAHLHLALGTVVKLQDKVDTRKPQIVFKLTEYQKKKDNNERTESPYFYTNPQGYHTCLLAYANGNGNGHVSVFVKILEGEHDNTLKWPFTGTYFIELLNQLEDKNHYLMSLNITSTHRLSVGSTWGYLQYIPHYELSHNPSNNTQYLKDDTLYFRVTVIPSDHKPWLDQYC